MRELIWKDAHLQETTPVAGHAASYLPSGHKWKLIWNDEFDGKEIDRTKWMCREHYWGMESPTFTKDFEGVEMDGDSHVRLHLIRKGDHFYSPHLQTGSNSFDIPKDSNGFWPMGAYRKPLFMHCYGYYEIRCRLPKSDGWHSAFWLQAPGIGAHPDPKFGGVECDIMENYRQYTQHTIGCGSGWGGYGKNCKWCGHLWFPYEETQDGWHNYAVDWSPEGYFFYADGKLVGMQTPPECPVSSVEQFVLISTECHGYHRSGNRGGLENAYVMNNQPDPLLFDAVLPDYFEVDYVRVFDRVEE